MTHKTLIPAYFDEKDITTDFIEHFFDEGEYIEQHCNAVGFYEGRVLEICWINTSYIIQFKLLAKFAQSTFESLRSDVEEFVKSVHEDNNGTLYVTTRCNKKEQIISLFFYSVESVEVED